MTAMTGASKRSLASPRHALGRIVRAVVFWFLAMLLILAALLLAQPAWSQALQEPPVPPGAGPQCAEGYVAIGTSATTGAVLKTFSDQELTLYVLGYVDAALASPVYAATAQCLEAVVACTKGRKLPDLVSIVRVYLYGYPKPEEPASGLLYNALFRHCIVDHVKNRQRAF